MSTPKIKLTGVHKLFGDKVVLDGIDLEVAPGESLVIIGGSGSGKSVTLKCILGLLTPDSGEGTCLGYDIRRDADKIKRRVGYMTQRFSLYQDLSVRENLEFVARLYGVPDPRGAAREMIKRIGLSGREEQLAGAHRRRPEAETGAGAAHGGL